MRKLVITLVLFVLISSISLAELVPLKQGKSKTANPGKLIINNVEIPLIPNDFDPLFAQLRAALKPVKGEKPNSIIYFYGNGQRIAKKEIYQDSEKMFYFHNDHLGSATIITNETGHVVEEKKYDPFGVELNGESKIGYNSKELDKDTELNYYGARYYGSEFGRFITPDKIEFTDINDPQSLNRYVYVKNNPIKYNDPTGEFGWIGAGVGFIVGGGSSIILDKIQGRDISWKAAGISAASGAVGGLYGNVLAGVGTSLARKAAVGGGIAATESAVFQYATTGEVDLEQIATAAIGGAIGAVVKLPKKAADVTDVIPTRTKPKIESLVQQTQKAGNIRPQIPRTRPRLRSDAEVANALDRVPASHSGSGSAAGGPKIDPKPPLKTGAQVSKEAMENWPSGRMHEYVKERGVSEYRGGLY